MQGFASTVASLGRRHAGPVVADQAAGGRPTGSEGGTRAVVVQAAGLWLVTRLAFFILTLVAVPLNGQSAHGAFNNHSVSRAALVAAWDRWDTQWFSGIGVHGYSTVNTTAFLPLFPALIHAVVIVAGGGNAVVAALVIANLGTLAAFIGVGLLAAEEYGRIAASGAIRALSAFPLAFYLAAGYSDSLFIALATFALLFARKRLWYWAALCACLAAFDRVFGLVLIAPLLWEYFSRRPARPTTPGAWLRLLGPAAALAAAVPLALVLWGSYLWARFGDPLVYFTAERKFWGHYAIWPWHWFHLAATALQHQPADSFVQIRVLFDLVPVAVIAVLTIVGVRRLPVSFTLYLIGILLICLTSAIPDNFDPFVSQGRYVMAAIPAFLLLGRWMQRYPTLDLLVVSTGFLLQGVFTAFFLRGGWLV